MVVQNNKMKKALGDVLSRNNYLVTQANDLSKSFGKLTTFQHKVLDYCFSCVQKDDSAGKKYRIKAVDMIHYFGMQSSGASYNRIVKAFQALNEKTAIYLKIQDDDGSWGIRMTSLFGYIDTFTSGQITFVFNPYVAPYVFQLKKRYYSFRLSDLAHVKSKYTLTLLKLWNANGMGKWDSAHRKLPDAVIEGTLDEFEMWFLGLDKDGKPKHWTPGRFRQKVLNVATEEIDNLYPNLVVDVTPKAEGRRVVGYRIEIHQVRTNLTM